jgi:hypothetical protein
MDESLDTSLHSELKKKYRLADEGWSDRYEKGAHDISFAVGYQWEDNEKSEREADGRPALVINKLMKFINSVCGDQKQNRPEGKVFPVDSNSDPVIAEVYQDLVRHIEYKSDADAVYDFGFKQCLTGSIGYWRVLSEYENKDTFEQGLRIRKIRNQFTVLFDPDAKDPNYRDARYVFIMDKMTKEEYKRQYPKEDMSDFSGGNLRSKDKSWFRGEYVLLAECYYKKKKKKKLALLSDGQTVELDDEVTEKFLEEQGLEVVDTRDSEYDEIYWVKMNGNKIIDGPDKQPGKYLPVIAVPGDEIIIEGQSHMFSLIRHAKDPQRMLNYFHSSAVEAVAVQGNDPYLVTPKMIQGHEKEWREAPRRTRVARQYNYDPMAGKPERKPPPSIATGAFAEVDKFDSEIYDTVGMYPQSLGGPSSERSNNLLVTRQRASDKGIFGFFDSHARAVAHTARVLVDLIPYYYDTERIINVLGDDEEIRQITINKIQQNPVTYKVETVNDLANAGEYDVVTKAGPSFETKRQQTAEFLMQFVQFAPQTAPILFPLVAKNLDVPGASDVADILMATLPPEQRALLEGQPPEAVPQDASQGLPPEAQGVPQQVPLPMG